MQSTATTHRMSAGTWGLLVCLSILWGGTFLFYKVLASELPPLTVALGRVAIGAASLGVFLLAGGTSLAIPRVLWRRFAMLGMLNNVIPFALFAWAEHRVSSGTAAILNATTPVFVMLVAGLILRTERLGAARIGGIALAFAGVAVLVGPSALLGWDLLGSDLGGPDLIGEGACLLAALSYGFAVPYGRTITGAPAGRGLQSGQVAFGQMAASTALLIPLAALADRPWGLPGPSPAGWASLVGLGVLSTGVAYLLFFQILARAGATNLSLVTMLIPVPSLLLGALLLAEPITAQAVAGMALIAAGFAVIDGRAAEWMFGRRARPADIVP